MAPATVDGRGNEPKQRPRGGRYRGRSLAPVSETTRQRPVFVYGTLRPGQRNWERLLAGATQRVVSGRLARVELVDCGQYPAAVERAGVAGAVGEVVWIRPDVWRSVLAALDHLEGYDPVDSERLFDRVVRPVETADGPVDCWVYLAGRMLARSARPVVGDGDWVTHRPRHPPSRHG